MHAPRPRTCAQGVTPWAQKKSTPRDFLTIALYAFLSVSRGINSCAHIEARVHARLLCIFGTPAKCKELNVPWRYTYQIWINSVGSCSLLLGLCCHPDSTLLLTHHDVRAANKLAAHVDLREGGPLAVLLHATPQHVIVQDIHYLRWSRQ